MKHLSHRVKRLGTSATMAMAARTIELKRTGRSIINLGVGESDFDTPDFIKEAAWQAIRENKTRYTLTRGILELREAVCRRLEEDHQLRYNPAEILVGNGAKQAIYNVIMALIDEGDEVIIPSPYWPSHPEMICLAGGLPIFVDCPAQNSFKLTPEQLRMAITPRTKALLISNPANPTGMVYTKSELQALGDVLSGSGIVVLSDEIYAPLLYDDVDFASMGILRDMTDVVLFQGVSKAYAMTGWRIGYAAGPVDLIDAAEKVQSHNSSNPASISQYAALAALNAPQDFVKQMRDTFAERRRFVQQKLSEIKDISFEKPYGAFYFFPDVSAFFKGSIENAFDFCNLLLEKADVSTVPGSGFGMEGYARISYAASMEQLEEAFSKIQKLLQEGFA